MIQIYFLFYNLEKIVDNKTSLCYAVVKHKILIKKIEKILNIERRKSMKNLFEDIKKNWKVDLLWIISGVIVGMGIKWMVEHLL